MREVLSAPGYVRMDEAVEFMESSPELINSHKFYDMTIINGFEDSLTEEELEVYESSYAYIDFPPTKTFEELAETIKTLQANFIKSSTDKAEKICNMQGIY